MRRDLLDLHVSIPIPGLDVGWRVVQLHANRTEHYVVVSSPDGYQRYSGLCFSWLSALQYGIRNGYTYAGENPEFRDIPAPEDAVLQPLADYLKLMVDEQLDIKGGGPAPAFVELPPRGELVILEARRRRLSDS